MMMSKTNSEANPLRAAYDLLRASSPKELAQKFIQEDQRMIKEGVWDYANQNLLINRIKEYVEVAVCSELKLNEQDKDDLRSVLWFWYHHSIGFAIWDTKDQTKAKEFSTKALEYQTDDNPNKITRLLYLLVHNKETEAAEWLNTITTDPDKTASRGIWQEYKSGNFFK